MTALPARARAWMAADPDNITADNLTRTVDAATQSADATRQAQALHELSERFAGPLEFGTAGLRGIMGAGESRMNRAVVRRTCFGLGKYLLANAPALQEPGV